MTRIAVPVSAGEISEHFDNSQYFIGYEINGVRIIKRNVEDVQISDRTLILEWLFKQQIDILLVKGIHKNDVRMLNNRKIQVYVGCQENLPDEAVRDFIKGELITDPTL